MYTYKNFTGSVPQIIKHFQLDVKPKTVYNRLQSGMCLDKAVEVPVTRNKLYTYKGFTGNVPAILKHFKCEIKLKTVYDRLSKGMSIEDAIEQPLRYNNV